MPIPDWAQQFAPLSATGWTIREGQAKLATAFSKALDNSTSVIGEAETGTGKSLAAAIPIIHKIREAKAAHKTFRAVISTETITLQDQIVGKDLPNVQKLYSNIDFSYTKLMGRSNYLCLDSAHAETAGAGDSALNNLYMRLEAGAQRLTTGERGDVEAILGQDLTTEQWSYLTGSSEFCLDNECQDSKRCFGHKARTIAASSDIVVCNHAILATDVESKRNTAAIDGEGLLGTFDALVVDEGHRLVPVFVSQFTEVVNGWEITQMTGDIISGVSAVNGKVKVDASAITQASELILQFMTVAITYYSYGVENWNYHEAPLVPRTFSSASEDFMNVMTWFETEGIRTLEHSIMVLDTYHRSVHKYLQQNPKGKGMSKIRKSYRQTAKLKNICTIIRESLVSKEGIVNYYGMYGVVIRGWTKRDGTLGASIELEPLDVSPQLKMLWGSANTNLLMSATLSDPTNNDPYRFVKVSTGFPTAPIVVSESPFNFDDQQLVYVTDRSKPVLDGTRYSFQELHELLLASSGRSLVLFTSRKELDEAASRLRILSSKGELPYMVYVQEKDSDKKKLAQAFKEDTSSILLGLDSFMTGFDAPGETLSQVILCKFPNPRYSAQMKQKIAYWRTRGFPNYYSRAALEKFIQATGRLIRSDDCKGVVSIIDQSVMDKKSAVSKTAQLGISQMKSTMTQDYSEIRKFIDG